MSFSSFAEDEDFAMHGTISSLEDIASVFYKGRAFLSAKADIKGMAQVDFDIDAMRTRLQDAYDQFNADTGRSMRSVSKGAGMGYGYLHSVLVEKKEPTISRLSALCDEMNVSLPWVMYGYNISPDSVKILSRLEKNPGKREGILKLLEG